MGVGLIGDDLVYHTIRDTVEACLQIAHDLVLDLDQNGAGL